MTFQGRGGGGGGRPPDGFVPPPASTPRPVPCRSPGSGILHCAATALKHPPTSLAPAAAAAAAAAPPSTPSSPAAPAGLVISATAPPPPAGLRDVSHMALVPFVSEAALPPPASTPRPVPCRSPGSGILRRETMALPRHAACGAPPLLHRPSVCGFSRRPPVSVAPRKLVVQRTDLASSSCSSPPSSAAPAGWVFSAPPALSPAGLLRLQDVVDEVPLVSEAALPPPGAAGPSALDLAPACLPRPARRGLGTICLGDVDSINWHAYDDQDIRYKMTGIIPFPTSHLIFPVDEKATRVKHVQSYAYYNCRLSYGGWPHFQPGCHLEPMEVCHVTEGRRCSRKFDKKRTNVLRATCHQEIKHSNLVVLPEKTAEDKSSQELDRNVCSDLVITVAARMLPLPVHQDIRYKMTEIIPLPMSHLIFPVDEKATRVKHVQSFGYYNCRLPYGSWPHFQPGSHSEPMEVCHVTEGRRCSRKFDKQRTNVLRATCHHDIELSISDMVLPEKNAEDKSSQELDRNVCTGLVMTVAAHEQPPPMVNVFFCAFRIRIPAIGATVLDLVRLALLKHNIKIRLQDFYLMLNYKKTDGSVLVNSIPNLDESTICVCPRLRGGAFVQQPVMYIPLDVIINNNSDQLFSEVEIPSDMVDPKCTYGPFAIFLNALPQFAIHQLLLLVCQEGHLQGHCYYGRFDMSRVLVSVCGHVRFSSDVRKELYTPQGGEADYQRLFFVVLVFVDFRRQRYPTHVSALLSLLSSTHESLRQKKEFIAFLVNHPSLLMFAEKQMLYALVDSFFFYLLNTTFADPTAQAEVKAIKEWLQTTESLAWEQNLPNIPTFDRTYRHGFQSSIGGQVSKYQKNAQQCFRLSSNYLAHNLLVGLMKAEAAVSYLFEFVLPLVLYNLAKYLSGDNGDDFIAIVSNPRADRTVMTPYYLTAEKTLRDADAHIEGN